MLLNKLLNPSCVISTSVRNNCPWWRNSFTPCYFRFRADKKVKKGTVEGRLKTRGGRLILMKRILQEKPFIAWNMKTDPPEKRLSYPL
ncbi:unnamed protein product [Enterobius vermicularis]|uniref:39S ribosomal protein L34, mitochondrial n=1 Tax=Enterobius vermicularis TaxID=51028 RepID=A0A0N4VA86_ENTVE|nr:unnamed protein product [Enterobius vermicularis]